MEFSNDLKTKWIEQGFTYDDFIVLTDGSDDELFDLMREYITNTNHEIELYKTAREKLEVEVFKYKQKENAIDTFQKSVKEHFKTFLEQQPPMTKLGKATTNYLQDSPPKLVIENKEIIPYKYAVPEIKLDNGAIKRDLMTGVTVPGAHIEIGKTLMMK